MNFTFADISSIYSNMVQNVASGKKMKGVKSAAAEKGNGEKPVFEEKLTKTLEKDSSSEKESSSLGESTSIQKGKVEEIVEALSEKLDEKSGTGFAVALKTLFLMLSNGNMDNVSLNEDGVDALKKILVQAGFEETEINELIASLSEDSEDGTLPLDSFFDGLFKLTEAGVSKDEEDPETFMETSFLPVLESILLSMGIPEEKVKEILSSADKGDNGISMDVVIQELKSVRRTAFYNNTQYQTKQGDENIGTILQQLGIVTEDAQTAPFSLDDMIASLEALRKKMAAGQTDLTAASSSVQTDEENGVKEILNKLFSGLEVKNEPVQTSLFEFSETRIKDPIKASFLALSDKILTEGAKPEEGTSLKQMFKEMSAFFEKENSVQTNEPQALGKNIAAALKEMKTDGKSQDLLQAAGTDVKANDTQSTTAGLKTTSTPKQLPEFVTRQVGRSIVRAVNQGESTLRIQLKPPELGRMMMTIENTGSTLKVSIVTETHAAKEILASNTTELKTVLSNSGVNLEQFEVDMSSNFRQSMADARNQSGNFSGKHRNSNGRDQAGNSSEETDDALRIDGQLNPDGSLHYVA